MANLGRLSMRLNRKSAENSGKQWRNSSPTSCVFHGRDASVSRRARGTDTSTSVATVAMAMPTAAMAVLRVRKSRMAKAAMAATDRSAWLMPAR